MGVLAGLAAAKRERAKEVYPLERRKGPALSSDWVVLPLFSCVATRFKPTLSCCIDPNNNYFHLLFCLSLSRLVCMYVCCQLRPRGTSWLIVQCVCSSGCNQNGRDRISTASGHNFIFWSSWQSDCSRGFLGYLIKVTAGTFGSYWVYHCKPSYIYDCSFVMRCRARTWLLNSIEGYIIDILLHYCFVCVAPVYNPFASLYIWQINMWGLVKSLYWWVLYNSKNYIILFFLDILVWFWKKERYIKKKRRILWRLLLSLELAI